MKRILDIGNCGPDHSAIKRLLAGHFDCQVHQAQLPSDSLRALRDQDYDLVLVNRKLDADYSDGIEIIRQMKADEQLARIPVMLITNYADHQQTAVDLGALPGFGKLEFEKTETIEALRAILA